MTPVDAGHPDYDSNEFDNPDDYRPGAGGASFGASALVGVPVLLYAADEKASTAAEAKPGSTFYVIHGRFCDAAMRLTNKSGELVQRVEIGEPFSTSTGAGMVKPVLAKMLRDGKLRSIDAGEHVRGVIGRFMQGKATKGLPPLRFDVCSVDEQREYRAALEAADASAAD